MKLNEIRDNFGATHERKHVGRGIGSGLGKTSGRGHKGQKARGTGKVRLGFEGGQNPIYRRLPKRGFNNSNFTTNYFVLNLGKIATLIETNIIDASQMLTENYLRQVGLIKGNFDGISVLAKGDINTIVNIQASKVSKVALEKIVALGGTVEILQKKKFVIQKNKQ